MHAKNVNPSLFAQGRGACELVTKYSAEKIPDGRFAHASLTSLTFNEDTQNVGIEQNEPRVKSLKNLLEDQFLRS